MIGTYNYLPKVDHLGPRDELGEEDRGNSRLSR